MSKIDIDWSKAPEGTTGAMVAHFDGGETRCGDVEFIPSDEPCRSIYKEGPDSWVYHPAPSATHWTGEGLPPVGTVCEANNGGASEYFKCVVVGTHYKTGMPIIDSVNSTTGNLTHAPDCWKFRPLRTPEQIAAEERLHNVRSACTDIAHYLKGDIPGYAVVCTVIEAMIDAGYRKAKE